MSNRPQLISPAGNLECARAAVANGADAVYFGLPRFNARMRADNFTAEQLPELVRFLHDHRVRAYAVLNVLIFTDELADAERELIDLDAAGVDAVIVQDLGVARLARELGLRLEVHASTQMTITSPEGVRFAAGLGITRVILARETSLKELAKFGVTGVALETFVHGALCIAYSGQCLTSEALGQRSANRGECAQACRLPYELIVDGIVQDLGDRRYLLSPQDLASVKEIPELIRLGVAGFKIEGRLKTPEYVAATTQVYRRAIDAVLGPAENPVTYVTENSATPPTAAEDWYKLEMTFSRGLYPGWMHGVNHQELVHARFGKKRGPLAGFVKRVGPDHVEVDGPDQSCARLHPGDGVVFDTGGDPDQEQGGRVWEIRDRCLYFEGGHLNFAKLKPGDRIWKTSDPQLDRALKRTYQGEIPRPKEQIDLVVGGAAGQPLSVEAMGRRVHSRIPLQTAYRRPLTEKLLREQLGRLGETRFVLGELENRLVGQVILPVSELNRLRREIVAQIDQPATAGTASEQSSSLPGTPEPVLDRLLARLPGRSVPAGEPELIALCRTTAQLGAALDSGCGTVHVDFEDLRRYADAVAGVRRHPGARVFLATPRIQKAGEQGFFKVIESAEPDGVLIRNLGGLDYFRQSPLRKIGDFSLNVANPLAADLLIGEGLERITVSYDLNAQQVLDLLRAAPPGWFELTVHQHLPMFHMEHCVFAAFLTNGTDFTNCGRPCDRVQLKLRDRVGAEHPIKADVGCRNTVYHARAQSGAPYVAEFVAAGARFLRVELLDEDAAQTAAVLQGYRDLIDGRIREPEKLLGRLKAVSQLGVTSGTLTVLG